MLCGLVGDDVDDTGDGVGAIEGGGGAVEDLDTFDSGHVDPREIDVVGDVAGELLAVDEDEDVFVAKAIETEEGSHGVGSHRRLGHHTGQGVAEVGDALFMDLLSGEDVNGRGGAFQSLVVAGTGHDDGIKVIGTSRHRRIGAFHLVDLCLSA